MQLTVSGKQITSKTSFAETTTPIPTRFFLFLINFTLTRNAFVVVVVVVVVVTAAQTRVFFPQSPQFSLSAAPFFDNCGKSFVCM
jgi:hypothetical protein